MLLVLPPSETKRDGGARGSALELGALSFPALDQPRRAALAGLGTLARDDVAAAAALKLGANGARELERNRAIGSSPTMPALERYTGVLYDALDATTLSPAAREFASRSVAICSALFGLLGADDPIPAYRLSHDSKLPGLRLPALWRDPIRQTLAERKGLLLDLRSESYVKLGPVPARDDAFYVRVVAVGKDGRKRALTHFNKKGKGALVRAVLEAGIDTDDVDELISASGECGVRFERAEQGVLELIV
jgi:cytoplasmic iron level regulating protein YaaA (DUF328/UPF0246 family)